MDADHGCVLRVTIYFYPFDLSTSFNHAQGGIVIHHNLDTAHELNPQFAIIAGYRVQPATLPPAV